MLCLHVLEFVMGRGSNMIERGVRIGKKTPTPLVYILQSVWSVVVTGRYQTYRRNDGSSSGASGWCLGIVVPPIMPSLHEAVCISDLRDACRSSVRKYYSPNS